MTDKKEDEGFVYGFEVLEKKKTGQNWDWTRTEPRLKSN